MKREKKEYLVISFDSTAHAMQVESYCMEREIPGRLIPIPKAITAGCGLAWRAEITVKDQLLKEFEDAGINYQGVYQLML